MMFEELSKKWRQTAKIFQGPNTGAIQGYVSPPAICSQFLAWGGSGADGPSCFVAVLKVLSVDVGGG